MLVAGAGNYLRTFLRKICVFGRYFRMAVVLARCLVRSAANGSVFGQALGAPTKNRVERPINAPPRGTLSRVHGGGPVDAVGEFRQIDLFGLGALALVG